MVSSMPVRARPGTPSVRSAPSSRAVTPPPRSPDIAIVPPRVNSATAGMAGPPAGGATTARAVASADERHDERPQAGADDGRRESHRDRPPRVRHRADDDGGTDAQQDRAENTEPVVSDGGEC